MKGKKKKKKKKTILNLPDTNTNFFLNWEEGEKSFCTVRQETKTRPPDKHENWHLKM